MIERAVVDAACDAATEEDLATLKQQPKVAGDALARRDFAKLEALIEYHRLIARATRNPVLVFVMDALMAMMHDYAVGIGPDKNKLSILSLQEVNAQMRRRDKTKAGWAMAEHLEPAKDRYLAHQRQRAPHGEHRQRAARPAPHSGPRTARRSRAAAQAGLAQVDE